jgi:hypothetical protein
MMVTKAMLVRLRARLLISHRLEGHRAGSRRRVAARFVGAPATAGTGANARTDDELRAVWLKSHADGSPAYSPSTVKSASINTL